MAERKVTVKLDLKPGDSSQFKSEMAKIGELNKNMDPSALRERAKVLIQLENAQSKFNRLLKAEKENLAPTVTAAGEGGGIGGLLGLGALAETLGPVGIAIGAVSVAALSATVAFEKLVSISTKFSEINSPGTVMRFDFAVRNMQGVIGRVFTPVVEQLTILFNLFGDFLSTILPSSNEMRSALEPLKDTFVELRSILQDLSPLLKTVVNFQLKYLHDGIKLINNSMLPMAGILGALAGGGSPLKSGLGFASYPASFTSASGYAQQVYAAAATQTAGLGIQDPAAQTAQNTLDMSDKLSILINLLSTPVTVNGAARAIGNATGAPIGVGVAGVIGKMLFGIP